MQALCLARALLHSALVMICVRAAACVLSVFLLAAPTPALACSGPVCSDGMPFPRSAANLPANLPGFPFSAGLAANRFDPDSGPPSSLRLRNAEGTLVPMTSRAMSRQDVSVTLQQFSQLYVPDGVLTPGAYTLEYDHALGCVPPDAGALTIPLTLVAPAAWPTSLGTLSAVPLPRGMVTVDSGGSCQEQVDAAQIRLELGASPEYEAFRSLAFVDVTVDGAPWRGVARGPQTTIGATRSSTRP